MPFYGAPGILLNGVQTSAITILGNGAAVSGGEITVNGFNITNGIEVINNPTVLNISGAGQTLTETVISPSRVQYATGNAGGNGGSFGFELNAEPTLGNLLLVFMSGNGVAGGAAVPGYVRLQAVNTGNTWSACFWKVCENPASDQSVTAEGNGNDNGYTVFFVEYENYVLPLSSYAGTDGAGATISGADITTAQGNLIVSEYGLNGGSAGSPAVSVSNGGTVVHGQTDDLGYYNFFTEEIAPSGASAQSVTMTSATTNTTAFTQIVIPANQSSTQANLAIT